MGGIVVGGGGKEVLPVFKFAFFDAVCLVALAEGLIERGCGGGVFLIGGKGFGDGVEVLDGRVEFEIEGGGYAELGQGVFDG